MSVCAAIASVYGDDQIIIDRFTFAEIREEADRIYWDTFNRLDSRIHTADAAEVARAVSESYKAAMGKVYGTPARQCGGGYWLPVESL